VKSPTIKRIFRVCTREKPETLPYSEIGIVNPRRIYCIVVIVEILVQKIEDEHWCS
jgi:hypothetical protein